MPTSAYSLPCWQARPSPSWAVHGLDPYAGVLHAADGHQPACGLDIMEPLRCLADRLVLRLAHHALTPADFTCGDAGCYLADGRRGVFYGAWEALLAERVLWHGVHQEYRRIIHAQVSAYAAHLDDPATPLQPLLLHDIGRV
jgi:CRISPR/Cas system-associated endonuclease Cas1